MYRPMTFIEATVTLEVIRSLDGICHYIKTCYCMALSNFKAIKDTRDFFFFFFFGGGVGCFKILFYSVQCCISERQSLRGYTCFTSISCCYLYFYNIQEFGRNLRSVAAVDLVLPSSTVIINCYEVQLSQS